MRRIAALSTAAALLLAAPACSVRILGTPQPGPGASGSNTGPAGPSTAVTASTSSAWSGPSTPPTSPEPSPTDVSTAISEGSSSSAAGPTPVSSTAAPTTANSEPTGSTGAIDAPVTAWTLSVATAVPSTWSQAFVAAYGPAESKLGSAPGGDNGTLTIGPEYAARSGDGTWLVLDAAKRRVAHLSAAGAYLGEVGIPGPLLAEGVYFQYQLPRILADGSLVAVSQVGDVSRLLRVQGTSVAGVTTSAQVFTVADDGKTLYGFGDDGATVAVDPDTGKVTPSAYFRTQAGNRYRITISPEGSIVVELPDAPGGVTLALPLRGPVAETVHASIQVAGGADGALHLFVAGFAEADEPVQLAGYARVSAAGVATAMEPMRDPTSPADPGSPANLGISPGSTSPYLVFVDPDGLRAYLRADA